MKNMKRFPCPLDHLSISPSLFLARNAQYHRVVTGALVFHADRLLIVQRAAAENFAGNRWEYPGGSAEMDDPTIFHALMRELREETGLRGSKVVRQIGAHVEFETGDLVKVRWIKLSFEVEVAGREAVDVDASEELEVEQGQVATPIVMHEEPPFVQLDPREHQDYLWISEEELKAGCVGGRELQFATEEQKLVMLLAFRVRKGEEEEGEASAGVMIEQK
ncbi:hypothetical protein M501DRAFT_997342 [Patellaria atrata CBS 101060]|uniref:Nudix hydrolase domain-containing protein n=1 Tax=Patellaria atrata CBS 101060 TaxID=1346257 RepID=A0A9P4S4N3_9PEZI|nr:hypothetical protein M501DRAFT_997342 [Patellaria atrata CBS 101060]